jgi:hypothetical protein
MWPNYYAEEKLRELKAEQRRRQPAPATVTARPSFAPVLRVAGRLIRRTGERLEAWAAGPEAEPEPQRQWAERRAR